MAALCRGNPDGGEKLRLKCAGGVVFWRNGRSSHRSLGFRSSLRHGAPEKKMQQETP